MVDQPTRNFFHKLLVWDDAERRDGPENMAIDELLLHIDTPVLRLYSWSQPWVTVGTMTSARDAQQFAGDRPWVRRWTGGGMVEHGDDTTIAIAIPSASMKLPTKAAEIYRSIHTAAAQVLERNNHGIRVASYHDANPGPQCFTSPVCDDLLQNDRKILGGALRRTKGGILYQGSLQNSQTPAEFPRKLSSALAATVLFWEPSQKFISDAENLAAVRYRSEAWNFSHP